MINVLFANPRLHRNCSWQYNKDDVSFYTPNYLSFVLNSIHNVFCLQCWRSRYVRHCPIGPRRIRQGGHSMGRTRLTAPATVARIAYVCSDVVLSVQPTLGRDSEFSRHLQNLVARKSLGIVSKQVPEVHSLFLERVTIHLSTSDRCK